MLPLNRQRVCIKCSSEMSNILLARDLLALGIAVCKQHWRTLKEGQNRQLYLITAKPDLVHQEQHADDLVNKGNKEKKTRKL